MGLAACQERAVYAFTKAVKRAPGGDDEYASLPHVAATVAVIEDSAAASGFDGLATSGVWYLAHFVPFTLHQGFPALKEHRQITSRPTVSLKLP